MTSASHRTLILSLDGATWDVLSPLLKAGRLPTIEGLVNGGVSGPLKSVVPPVTTAAWTSFQTGMKPAHHGVFTFHRATDRGRSRGLVDATTPSYATLWDYLDADKRQSIVVNLPVTYPADAVNGEVVSGLLAPSFSDGAAASDSARSAVEAVASDYEILRNPSGEFSPHDDPTQFIKAMETNAESRVRVAKQLMQDNPDWNVCMMHIQSTDVLQHPLWKHIDETHPAFDAAINSRIAQFYEYVDSMLADVIETARHASDDLDIVLVSDHGFQRMERKVYVDAWLEQQGLLTRPTDSVLDNALKTALKTVKRADILDLRHKMLNQETVSSLGNTARSAGVDWDRTTAWGYGNLYGYVFVQNTSQRTRVYDALHSIGEEYSGPQLVKEIIDVKGTIDTPHPEAPDFIIVPTPGTTFETLNSTTEDSVISPVDDDRDFHIGGHAKDGIFALTGPGIPERTEVHDARLIDLMPTILHRHGLGVPDGLDGTVLTAASNDIDINYIEALDKAQSDLGRADDSEAVEERLRSLGYVE